MGAKMIEALWAVVFSSQVGTLATGVAVFESQRIFGGDGTFFYPGDYAVSGTTISGKVEVTHYSGRPMSVLGPTQKLTLEFEGQIAGNTIRGDGVTLGEPQQRLTITCHRLARLPVGAAIFAQYQNSVDARLATTAETASSRLPEAYERLADGGSEAVSHADYVPTRDRQFRKRFLPRVKPLVLGRGDQGRAS
jgi:hypothetical protein